MANLLFLILVLHHLEKFFGSNSKNLYKLDAVVIPLSSICNAISIGVLSLSDGSILEVVVVVDSVDLVELFDLVVVVFVVL